MEYAGLLKQWYNNGNIDSNTDNDGGSDYADESGDEATVEEHAQL